MGLEQTDNHCKGELGSPFYQLGIRRGLLGSSLSLAFATLRPAKAVKNCSELNVCAQKIAPAFSALPYLTHMDVGNALLMYGALAALAVALSAAPKPTIYSQ